MARILIVEDEANLAQGLLFNLQAEGHEVSVEGDGDSALDCLRRQPFDAAARMWSADLRPERTTTCPSLST